MQNEIAPISYKQIAFGNGVSGLFKLVTLGATAHIFRNFALSLALVPREYGSDYEPVQALFALGAILVSHPFEVARVLIVNNGSGKLDATLKSLYASEGIAGLYRGFVPRTIHMLPALMTLNYFTNPRNSWIIQPKAGFSDKQSGLAHI